nr:hypothetical protein CFP56_52801 [Quercus suber]
MTFKQDYPCFAPYGRAGACQHAWEEFIKRSPAEISGSLVQDGKFLYKGEDIRATIVVQFCQRQTPLFINMLLNACLAGLLAIPAAVNAQAVCNSYTIPVEVNDVSNQLILAPTLDLTTIAGVESLLGSVLGLLGQLLKLAPVSGTFNIAAQYCEPGANSGAPAARATEVQLLLHGVPYNSPNDPGGEQYSWVDFATAQGYPVLAIDNLGAGDSDKADPITEVQQPLQTAIIHLITQQLRAGSLPFGPKASKVIFVGHSLSSVIGNGIASRWPDDFDAMILTGYSYDFVPAIIGLLTTMLVPAQVQDPARFPLSEFPPGYLTFNSSQGKLAAYYAEEGSYDPDLAAYDFAHQDTITVGQIVTAFAGLEAAADYTGDVFVLTGQEDAFFCGPLGTRELGEQDCGQGPTSIPAQSASFFPGSKNFQYYVAQNTAHATTLGYTAIEDIANAHRFLSRAGY